MVRNPSAAAATVAASTTALGRFPEYPEGALPESVGAALQAALDGALEDGSVRGATAAVIVADSGSWSGAVGVDRSGSALTAESQLLTASVGKTVTAAQVLRLVDEGRLRLDQRATDHFPAELSSYAANNATIRDLLSMRSGLLDPLDYVAMVDAGSTAADLVELIPQPMSSPGATNEYANINYVLLGEIIEEVTGRPLADAISAGVLDRKELEGIEYGVRDAMAADGWNIVTDALTLARWGYELYGGFVISDDALRAMADHNGDYGLGTIDFTDDYGAPALGHGGLEESHVVRLVAFPDTGMIVVVQANADGFDNIGRLVNSLKDAAES